MPYVSPPATAPPGPPTLETVHHGTLLWRIHNAAFEASQFNPMPANDPFRGGRFDSPDGSYSYLYAGDQLEGAVAEALLRDVPEAELTTTRHLPFAALAGRNISVLRVQRPFNVVYLSGAGAHALGQDSWLTTCDSAFYPHTRQWAVAIREWLPEVAGFKWRSRVDNDLFSFVLFGDRLLADTLVKHRPSTRCISKRGFDLAEAALAKYHVSISRA